MSQKQYFNTSAWTQLINMVFVSSFRCVRAGKTSHCAVQWPPGLLCDTPAVERKEPLENCGESDLDTNSENVMIWMGVNVALGAAEQQQ